MAKIIFIIQREEISSKRSVLPKVLFPIETALTASLLALSNHKVTSFDLNLIGKNEDWTKKFKKLLKDFNPGFVISAPQSLTFLIKESIQETADTFFHAKQYNPAIKTIYCGQFATSYPKKALKKSTADYIIRGEYDEAIRNLINTIEKGTVPLDIIGVMGKNSTKTTPIACSHIFKELPFPAYDEFNFKQYFQFPGKGNVRYAEHSHKYTHYLTSRGCTARCCFCNVSYLRGGRKYQIRPVETVLDDLERLTCEFGIEEIHFLDENMTMNPKRTIAICDGIVKRKICFKWIASGGMSIYSLNERLLQKLKTSGCYRLNLAIESGSQTVLKHLIHKPINLSKAMDVLSIAKRLDFEIIGFFIIGLPEETKEQIDKTLKLAASSHFDYVTFSIATPQAGTAFEKSCIEKGFLKADQSLESISKRSTGTFSTNEFTSFDLEKIRWKSWDKINFTTHKKREVICKMMGITNKELSSIREQTALQFHSRWPQNQ
ncbi:B12-binding domain-containing radical SAM protein [Desulfobacula toluolica]|uniref:Radical SAM domain protein n=1 Tax=Desulfobacula toluolica (strain DSM 7467 / Tol2) TaxID=651182 RepID=K0NJL0_DESTT|nr:radical SAM protein [Desulfobacula toluolica]CCK81691.1 radical SAM domain protein [Desulfobacula toluolica Tol2]